MTASARSIILGTAGHVDHGKTSLVRCLTGVDTDRLPEEKRRGMSIDLGFAHFDQDEFRFGVVDVPGHERFIRNMVAGAAGIDLALLVVAADDGVMPQTREHVQIMQLLGLAEGVIALSKIDRAGPARVARAAREVRDFAGGTFLAGAPILPLCCTTGEGLPALRAALVAAARRRAARARPELFRMPIDRAFTRAGVGAIVTGTVLGGSVAPGDTVELLPQRRLLRIRGVQNHGAPCPRGLAGQRVALNLVGITAAQVQRGHELAAPGFLRPSQNLLARVQCLADAPRNLAGRMTLQLHLATTEVTAQVIVQPAGIERGAAGYARLRPARGVVACAGQRFILRRASPPCTVAGGTILDPDLEPGLKAGELARLAEELGGGERVRLSCALRGREAVEAACRFAAWKAQVEPSRHAAVLGALKAAGEIVEWPGGWLHAERVEALLRAVLAQAERLIAARRPLRTVPRRDLVAVCGRLAPPAQVEAALRELEARGLLQNVAGHLGVRGWAVQPGRARDGLRQDLCARVAAAGLRPPSAGELASQTGQKPELVQSLLRCCVEDGLLHEVGEGLFFSAAAVEEARATCAATLERSGWVTVSQLRTAWGVSRKWGFPLCEYLNRLGVTVRDGHVHRPGPRLSATIPAIVAACPQPRR